MNILVLANRDLASNYALNLLLPALATEHQLTLWLSAQVGGNSANQSNNRPEALNTLKFFEQSLFNDLVEPLLPESSVIGKFCGFAGFNHYLKTPHQIVNNLNTVPALAELKALAPDVILSIRYGCILRSEAIQTARLGVLNFHSGILPDYRGVMATFWSMLNGAKQIGATLHTIDDASIDTGDIIAIVKQPVIADQCYLAHVLSLYQDGVIAMQNAVATLAAGQPLNKLPQPAGGNYFSFPTSADLARFSAQQQTLVDPQFWLSFIQQYYLPAPLNL
ncbi:formyl transferase [Pseudoalteromonas fenneropenaei]|uniref:Formyl transferase n=1 Tax=Pseudoalteromonas fenneropenaei TaxID=1737459 RepID=A0ABV7CEY4_9GAMM